MRWFLSLVTRGSASAPMTPSKRRQTGAINQHPRRQPPGGAAALARPDSDERRGVTGGARTNAGEGRVPSDHVLIVSVRAAWRPADEGPRGPGLLALSSACNAGDPLGTSSIAMNSDDRA